MYEYMCAISEEFDPNLEENGNVLLMIFNFEFGLRMDENGRQRGDELCSN